MSVANVEPSSAAEPQPPTSIAKKGPAGVDLSGIDESSTGALNAFSSAGNFATAQRIAKALSESTMVPLAYQGNIPNCLIAIELASRIGASVFAVMQSMDIIHGRPGWRSTFLIATVNASRRFSPIRFRWVSEQGRPDWGCRAVAKDLDTGEECVGALIDWNMVKAEGWYDRKGSKWQTMPEQMFMYRAAGFWTRVYAPEMSMGLRTAEEEQDVIDVQAIPVPAVPGSGPGEQGRRLSLSKRAEPTDSAAAATPTPSTADVISKPKPAEQPAEFVMATTKQRKDLIAACTEARVALGDIVKRFGKGSIEELSAGQVAEGMAMVMAVTGEVPREPGADDDR